MHQVQRPSLRRRLGPADRVTLTRAVLSLVVAALALVALVRPVDPWLVVPVASVALALDWVDGQVARRTGTASEFGARFDMETDAFLLAALSVYVAGPVGAWVLLIGAARYVFLLAQALLPRLRDPAPRRPWCKVVAVVQGVALVVAAAPLLPRWLDAAMLAGALALLLESFAHEAWDRWHSRGAAAPFPLVTFVAGLLVWVCLLVPDHPSELTWGHWARLPLEALLLAAVVLVLPRRPARAVAALAGVAVGLLALHSVLDLGFRLTFDKPFDPVYDHTYAAGAVELVEDSIGRWPGLITAVLAGLAALGLLVAVPWALGRLTAALRSHRPTALPVLAGLTAVWAVAALAGSGAAGREAATHAVDTVAQVRHDIAAERTFERALVGDSAAAPPAFASLRGRDVLVVFVESYGRTALTSETVTAALARGERRLTGTGWRSRSAWLTSPTYGGLSWLAHSTLQSGLWVDSERRYDALLGSRRPTLATMFGAAGWRTVNVTPSNRRPWPEGEEFYGWDRVYAGADLGYRGPEFGYAAMPDQFTLTALRRLELGRPGDVMAEVDLVSSHSPWAPLPRMVPWRDVGDGSVFAPMPLQGPSTAEVWSDPARVRASYEQSVAYSLDAVTSFLARLPSTRPGREPVVLLLGDHQPARVVSQPGSLSAPVSHDVPVTLLARDPAVLRRVNGWDWQAGLRPSTEAPVWPMDVVRDALVSAFR